MKKIRKKKRVSNPMENVYITPSGRLDPEFREKNEIHNMPESGDEGLFNEYSCNLPEARERPRPVNTEALQLDYWKWKARHLEGNPQKKYTI